MSNLAAAPGPSIRLFCLWTTCPLVSGIRKDRGFLLGPDSANGIFVGAKKVGSSVYQMRKGGSVMKKAFVLAVGLIIVLCFAGYSSAQDTAKQVWVNPVRYQIHVLKPGNTQWAAGFNEVILLNTETGQTWTLKSKKLIEGWVLMPRIDQPAK